MVRGRNWPFFFLDKDAVYEYIEIGGNMAKNSSGFNYKGSGVAGVGGAFAAVLSYCKWHSFWLAVGHYLCGWFYVAYYLITYGNPVK